MCRRYGPAGIIGLLEGQIWLPLQDGREGGSFFIFEDVSGIMIILTININKILLY